jgi:hypothetical protein
MSFQFDYNADRTAWPNKKGPFIAHATVFWKFSLSDDKKKFTIFLSRNCQPFSRTLHIKYAPILAFFDISLRQLIAKCEAGDTTLRRRSHYLQTISNVLETELRSMSDLDETLLSGAWIFKSLKYWAIRSCHSKGHSDTGRNDYRELCTKSGIQPYQEDPFEFGLHFRISHSTTS